MRTEFRIEGAAIHTIADLYDELNRLFMAQEDWRLGPSLDALDDLLYGGFGALVGVEAVVVWTDHRRSAEALGVAATRDWYRQKLELPGYNHDLFRERLRELDAGEGPTYFQLVQGVFADHPDVELRLE